VRTLTENSVAGALAKRYTRRASFALCAVMSSISMLLTLCTYQGRLLDFRLNGFEAGKFRSKDPLGVMCKHFANAVAFLPILLLSVFGPTSGWGSVRSILCYVFAIAMVPLWFYKADRAAPTSVGHFASRLCTLMTNMSTPIVLLYIRK
jgi:hypothetical protein